MTIQYHNDINVPIQMFVGVKYHKCIICGQLIGRKKRETRNIKFCRIAHLTCVRLLNKQKLKYKIMVIQH